jgi:hypothetical protein
MKTGTAGRGCEHCGQPLRIARLETGDLQQQPDALSGVAAFDGLRILPDPALGVPHLPPERLRVSQPGKRTGDVDDPPLILGKAQVVYLP